MSLFDESPNVMRSFDLINYSNFYNKSSENGLKRMFSLQESLVVFYTSNLDEVKSFIDFLIPQLSVRQRPKCLILYSNNQGRDEAKVGHILGYAWEKKFLDLSILFSAGIVNIVDSSSSIYYLNPFNCIIYETKLAENTEIFPNKLQNTFRYPFYIHKLTIRSNFYCFETQKQKIICQPNAKFEINFTASVMNLKVIERKVSNVSLGKFKNLKTNYFDMLTQWISAKYLSSFLIPLHRPFGKYVAVVPIFRNPRIKFSSVTLYTVIFIPMMILTIIYLLKYFKLRIEQIKVKDIFMLILGQSITREPKRLVHRIVLLTVVVASVKITNDFLLDILLIQFDNEEVPFETHKDLIDSKLQIYTVNKFLKESYYDDQDSSKIIKNTVLISNSKNCFDAIYKWKNASCITLDVKVPPIMEYYQKLDESPRMKIAKPPIQTIDNVYYEFSPGSPYAMKFLKIMRRAKETSLMDWIAFAGKSTQVWKSPEEPKITINEGVNTKQLLTILCFGLFSSCTVFIAELFIFFGRKMIEALKDKD